MSEVALVKLHNDKGKMVLRILAAFYEEDIIIDYKKGKYTIIIGPLELTLSKKAVKKLTDLLMFVMEQEVISV